MNALDALTDLFKMRASTAFIGSENFPFFTLKPVRDWVAVVCAKRADIEPSSHRECGR